MSNEHLITDYSLIPWPKENETYHLYLFKASCTVVAKVVLELGTIRKCHNIIFSKLGGAIHINELGSHYNFINSYIKCLLQDVHTLNTKQCVGYMARVLTNLLLHYSRNVFKFILPP